MLNAEKYKNDIIKVDYAFAVVDGEIISCSETDCIRCSLGNPNKGCTDASIQWLLSECEEPKIEDEVYRLKCDDKVEVSDDGVRWFKRHFKCVECGCVFTWASGFSSFTARNQTIRWKYARIPRKE